MIRLLPFFRIRYVIKVAARAPRAIAYKRFDGFIWAGFGGLSLTNIATQWGSILGSVERSSVGQYVFVRLPVMTAAIGLQ